MKTELFDLGGKVAIVTGGNGGIGLGMARGLAAAGAAVAIVGRNEAKSHAAVAELAQAGAKAISVVADVTDKEAVAAMTARVMRELGRIDILVNNAGINIRKPPHALDIAEWNSVIQTNLTSAFLCSQAVYPAMKAAGGGKIINIGSMMSIFGASFAPAYAASKGGIVQFTRSCACAWAADNIQANAVLPGWIDTDLTKRARTEIDGLHDRVLGRTPAARWGEIVGLRRHRGVSRFRRLRFRDRHRDTRRRRLFDHGLTPPNKKPRPCGRDLLVQPGENSDFATTGSPILRMLVQWPALTGDCTCSGRTPRPRSRAVMPCSHGTAVTRAHDQRRLQRLVTRLQRGIDDVVLDHDLHPLRHPHRKRAPPLHGIEFVLRRATACQFRSQQVCGRDRVLHREIDADAADRRHRMRGVADAKQPRQCPALAAG